MAAITTTQLRRIFGDITAVDGLDLTVTDGEIYGFLGPNGAGKSTTINMLLGFAPPSSGTGEVLGFDIQDESLAIRERTGILPEDFGLYNRLTARKHVQFAIDTKSGADDPEQVLERVGLGEAIDRKAGGFSSGMKQRLALAMALVDEPDLLILDEPSSGLDPNGAREMREIIRAENERGATIFFSSHIMEQVEAICDRVGIMRAGQLVAEDTIKGLKSQFNGTVQLVLTVDEVPAEISVTVGAIPAVESVEIADREIVVALTQATAKMSVIDAVEEAGATVVDIQSRDASLEDLFAELTLGDRVEAVQ